MNQGIDIHKEIDSITKVLNELRMGDKIRLALLYGSFAGGTPHKRSDIDLALYLNARDSQEEMEIIDMILMAVENEVSILRLDDEDESPFVVQEALKGIHLIEPDSEVLYELTHRVLHTCEEIRFRRGDSALNRAQRLLSFLEDTVGYFLAKVEGVDRDRYFADRDTRNILDKTINDLILCVVDIAEECLKQHKRTIPDTYKDTILACHEFFGDIVLTIAPLVRHRNEAIHQYLKVNWHNINVVKNRIPDIRDFIDTSKNVLLVPPPMAN